MFQFSLDQDGLVECWCWFWDCYVTVGQSGGVNLGLVSLSSTGSHCEKLRVLGEREHPIHVTWTGQRPTTGHWTASDHGQCKQWRNSTWSLSALDNWCQIHYIKVFSDDEGFKKDFRFWVAKVCLGSQTILITAVIRVTEGDFFYSYLAINRNMGVYRNPSNVLKQVKTSTGQQIKI